jgi:hypothetical protein
MLKISANCIDKIMLQTCSSSNSPPHPPAIGCRLCGSAREGRLHPASGWWRAVLRRRPDQLTLRRRLRGSGRDGLPPASGFWRGEETGGGPGEGSRSNANVLGFLGERDILGVMESIDSGDESIF